MKNQIVNCRCIDMTVDGQGICKYEGLVIFVRGMITGEEADVKIISEKKNLAYGIIDKLTLSSPYRVKTPCPVAYKCGGCDLQHVSYSFQLEIKKRNLINTFKNMGLNLNVRDVLPCDNEFHFRNKVQVPVRDHKFGFYRRYSNEIVEFDSCLIQSSLSDEIFSEVKKSLSDLRIDKYVRHILIKHGEGSGEVMLGIIASSKDIPHLNELVEYITGKYECIKSVILNINDKDTNVILGDEEILLYGRDYIYDTFEGIKVKISLKSFYQTNYSQMIKLYKLLKDISGITREDRVLDLYSGIGSISLYLSKYCKEIEGVEIVKEAVENAKENVRLNSLTNVKYYLDDASRNFEKYLKNKDLVIVDPPRKGLSKDLIESLINSGIKRIAYVSCNPATLARDLILFEKRYDISDIYPVDMFPQSVHVETVVLMSRAQK